MSIHQRLRGPSTFESRRGRFRAGSPPMDYVGMGERDYESPCSFERIRTLSLPVGASAYRVEWRPDGAAGLVRSLVVQA